MDISYFLASFDCFNFNLLAGVKYNNKKFPLMGKQFLWTMG